MRSRTSGVVTFRTNPGVFVQIEPRKFTNLDSMMKTNAREMIDETTKDKLHKNQAAE